MGKGKGYGAVLCDCVSADKLKLPYALVIVVQAGGISGVLFAKPYGKHCLKAELPFMGEADLDAVTFPGNVVHDIHRDGICFCLYGKVNVARLVRDDLLTVYAPQDAAAHIKGDGDVPAPDAVKNVSGDHRGSVHIHVDGAAFLRLFFLCPDHIPAGLAVPAFDERDACVRPGLCTAASRPCLSRLAGSRICCTLSRQFCDRPCVAVAAADAGVRHDSLRRGSGLLCHAALVMVSQRRYGFGIAVTAGAGIGPYPGVRAGRLLCHTA